MANLKFKDIKSMSGKDIEKKKTELDLELIKAKAGASKSGSSRIKEIKKMIARIKTFENLNKSNGANNGN